MTLKGPTVNVNSNAKPLSSMDIQTDKDMITAHKSNLIAEQGISRLTLGEIGNRVSAITIDSSKGGAVKKEILQPRDGVLTRARVAKTRQGNAFASVTSKRQIVTEDRPQPQHQKAESLEADLEAVKVEWMPDHNLLPSASRITQGDVALFDALSNAAPMDISDNGTDAFSKHPVLDIDAEDGDNPQLVSIYVNPIYAYMRQMEQKFSIRPTHLEGREITGKMRAILIDWLCQVHLRFHLLQETLYLTVAIIDRYLQAKACTRNRLQLVGVTAMLVASKYEEMYAPEVADFVYITDNAYTKQDVRDMEQDILRTLDFSFGRPHCLHFLRRNSKAGQVDATKHTLAKYLMELSLTEYSMAYVRPSLIAAAALYLSMTVLDSNSKWTETLKHYSSYSVEDLLPTASSLAQLVVKSETSKQTAVRTKYSSSKFMKIATIPQLKSKILLGFANQTDGS